MSDSPRKSLRILLSAYACEPGKGSEPGVGWNWALALARRGHEIWVLTRRNNQETIEPEYRRLEPALKARLHFTYYDLPKWASWWKKGGRGVHLYYLLWQWGAYQVAKKQHAENKFDRVQHATFVSVRQPSFMGGLGIPFIFGPVAGGERAPWRLRSGYGWRGWLLDAARDAANALVKVDPLMWRTFAQAERIYVTSGQTKNLVPRRYWPKTQIKLAIALDGPEAVRPHESHGVPSPRILYLGRFLYWKGMHLGLASFSRLLKSLPDARLSMIGCGPDEARWRQLANQLGMTDSIDWIPWVGQSELPALYRNHDVLLFPSLHDSGGMVVLEAMQNGLPVVCLKLGGPGVLVDETGGVALDPDGHSKCSLIDAVAHRLTGLCLDRKALAQKSTGARKRALEYGPDALAAAIYAPIETEQAVIVARNPLKDREPVVAA
ncbi:glycosyltransferase [Candidatus Accumulibacter phosphatis]|uniref:Glycosyltransferase n=1 Tax=Candidatus Accumulibacter phosphatis TaxID=327160 RepID=A0ABX1TVW4_9PROT|nr:glycosyltransferase family 4 protein [Candidatus Accumulibacter phosphatis]NMQ27383.1 glycosyltransferase [Candidatus Accumulibacter phosphatis]